MYNSYFFVKHVSQCYISIFSYILDIFFFPNVECSPRYPFRVFQFLLGWINTKTLKSPTNRYNYLSIDFKIKYITGYTGFNKEPVD